MGVHTTASTTLGALTPICCECGIALCWDISIEEYAEAKAFWDAWICEDCNDGERLSLRAWHERQNHDRAQWQGRRVR